MSVDKNSDGGKKCKKCKNVSRFYTKKQAKNLTGLVEHKKRSERPWW